MSSAGTTVAQILWTAAVASPLGVVGFFGARYLARKAGANERAWGVVGALGAPASLIAWDWLEMDRRLRIWREGERPTTSTESLSNCGDFGGVCPCPYDATTGRYECPDWVVQTCPWDPKWRVYRCPPEVV